MTEIGSRFSLLKYNNECIYDVFSSRIELQYDLRKRR